LAQVTKAFNSPAVSLLNYPMPHTKFVAVVFLLGGAVVQANQCSSDGECPTATVQTGVSLLQTKLQTNVFLAPDMNPALECLHRTTPDLQLTYPSDAEAHFKEIQAALAPFTRLWQDVANCYVGYCGPMIEGSWISHFNETWTAAGTDAKLSTVFGPYVPIFIRWQKITPKKKAEVWTVLQKVLRKDVAYITVSQDDLGPSKSADSFKRFPNLMVLSGGGYGHVPVPLLIKQLEEIEVPVSGRKFWMSFLGTLQGAKTHPTRNKMIGALAPLADATHEVKFGDPHKSGSSGSVTQDLPWQDVMAYSQFVLCPRGYGRTSFHLAETIQMGRIPIYVYSDVAWVPYADMFAKIGYVSQIDEVADLAKKLKTEVSEDQIMKMEKVLEEIAPTHFTMPGMMNQISGFMTAHKSDLRCQALPPTVRDDPRNPSLR